MLRQVPASDCFRFLVIVLVFVRCGTYSGYKNSSAVETYQQASSPGLQETTLYHKNTSNIQSGHTSVYLRQDELRIRTLPVTSAKVLNGSGQVVLWKYYFEAALFSASTSKFVQVTPTSVNALAKNPYNKYARLVFYSHPGGLLYIMGKGTKKYICIDNNGTVILRNKKVRSKCLFQEEVNEEGHLAYRLSKRKSAFLGFRNTGVAKPASKTSRRQRATHFQRRLL